MKKNAKSTTNFTTKTLTNDVTMNMISDTLRK